MQPGDESDYGLLGMKVIKESNFLHDHQLKDLNPDSRILQDLRIDGDNFYEFLEFLLDTHGVQFPPEFRWTDYSPSEGDLISPFNNRFFRVLGLGKDLSYHRYPALTVRDIGSWVVNGIAALPSSLDDQRND
jgi:hypothetical protein